MPPASSALSETVNSSSDDDLCMARLAAGETSALRPIFDRWKLALMNYLYRCLGSHADAEDLLLMVFEEVWRLAPRYRAGGTFGAWLFALARGRVRHEWRRRSRHPVTPVAPGELTEPADPSGDAGAVFEVEEALLYALRDLPAKQRDALLLSVHSTLTTPEAARSMGIRADYFHVLVNRARAALKRALSP